MLSRSGRRPAKKQKFCSFSKAENEPLKMEFYVCYSGYEYIQLEPRDVIISGGFSLLIQRTCVDDGEYAEKTDI